ncbi:hypothetical protein C8R44DRAFT_810288 [Mycena epipterygia]|nr:hypothetical protein C8R44DRAFT_810288 [Mycena epipterygia]
MALSRYLICFVVIANSFSVLTAGPISRPLTLKSMLNEPTSTARRSIPRCSTFGTRWIAHSMIRPLLLLFAKSSVLAAEFLGSRMRMIASRC